MFSLDRDGVLNRSLPDGRFVTRREQFELLPGVAATVAELNRSERKVIVVTNQRCVALGLCSDADLLAIHAHMRKELSAQGARLDAISVLTMRENAIVASHFLDCSNEPSATSRAQMHRTA